MLLTVNAGSSSLKLSAWSTSRPRPECHWRLDVDLRGVAPPRWTPAEPCPAPALATAGRDADTMLAAVMDWLQHTSTVEGVAHRVVHGGDIAQVACRIDPALRRTLESLAPLAPLHQPAALALIDAVDARFPGLPQTACFDTAFHARQPELYRRYALPEALYAEGIKAYGFHGLSYESVCRQLFAREPALREARVIVSHLGSGASACAINRGQSVSSTMGFSALDGLVMGTRCGRIDAGVLLYLTQAQGYDHRKLEDLLYRKSGLLGVSGISADVRVLLADESPAARLAIGIFCDRAAREIAGLIPTLGGIDALVFTGGIGEHQPAIRSAIVRQLHFLGAGIDESLNLASAPEISEPGAGVRVRVTPCDEESVMATETAGLLT